jgi:hypothetical protein
MRIQRVRFTIRRMMVAVAIAGVLFGATKAYQRLTRALQNEEWEKKYFWKVAYPSLAKRHEISEKAADALAHRFLSNPESAHLIPAYLILRDYHAALRSKWEHAARYPWLPVEPDPPEPD